MNVLEDLNRFPDGEDEWNPTLPKTFLQLPDALLEKLIVRGIEFRRAKPLGLDDDQAQCLAALCRMGKGCVIVNTKVLFEPNDGVAHGFTSLNILVEFPSVVD